MALESPIPHLPGPHSGPATIRPEGLDRGSTRPPTGSLGLTTEALLRSRRRVAMVAKIIIGLMLFSAPLQWLMYVTGELALSQVQQNLWGVVVAVCCSVGVLAISRSPRVSDATVIWLGLGFQVLFSVWIAYGTNLIFFQRTGEPSFMTWVTPMILLYPLIIPVGPRVVIVVGLAAAAAEPISLMLLSRTHGLEMEPRFIAVLINPVMAVGVTWFAARMIHRLNLDLSRARALGSYQLVARLGAGGMGEVWTAKHALLARPAAIKLVRTEGLGGSSTADVLLQRFEQEAQATASLRSPHTVQLYDFGRSDDGAFYIVMELLDGLDLQSLVDRFGPQPPARVVYLLRQVCHSLAEAHEAGMVHRDVKPANLYLCRYGLDNDFVKVLDFGLVKNRGDLPDAHVTNLGTVPGTPAYLAPEAALGDELDGRADLYALGCVAHYLLTGSLVFTGQTAVAVAAKHIGTTPAPLTSRTELPIPPDLEALVLACLSKEPADRPATATELAERLAACEISDWTPAQSSRWWQAHLPSKPKGNLDIGLHQMRKAAPEDPGRL